MSQCLGGIGDQEDIEYVASGELHSFQLDHDKVLAISSFGKGQTPCISLKRYTLEVRFDSMKIIF